MNKVQRIVSAVCIGMTANGDSVEANTVVFTNGKVDTLYRINNDDGKVYGLMAECPVIVGQVQGVLIEVSK